MSAETADEQPIGQQDWVNRVQHLADAANPAFAVGSVLVPLALLLGGYVAGNMTVLYYTHVGLGAIWFGLVLFIPLVLGPVLNAVGPEVAGQVGSQLTPKNTWFLGSVSTFTVVSGALYAKMAGYFAAPASPWMTLAVFLGVLIYLLGMVGPFRYNLKIYYEGASPEPDPERIGEFKQRMQYFGPVQAVLMLGILFVMTQMGGL